MNSKEAAKLLTLIKLSYPASYKGMDDEWMLATINMWTGSFPDVPYSLMEQGFNHYRMTHKFPPTVAEMVEELRHIYYEATEMALVHKGLENMELVAQYKMIMDYTARYKDDSHLGQLNLGGLQGLLIGGGGDAGASRNWLDDKDRLPFLDAGRD